MAGSRVAPKAARRLRRSGSDAERTLWRHLRDRQLDGLKFRRQQPIGGYVVDFACVERCLLVEVDGGQHAEAAEKDLQRTQWLNSEGYRVLRFWNNEVVENIEGVLETISRVARRG